MFSSAKCKDEKLYTAFFGISEFGIQKSKMSVKHLKIMGSCAIFKHRLRKDKDLYTYIC